ncbi:hypothetical protein MXB_5192 [Myxobolus squamalis]|nr:hypothetical protein MXB_5192 [Myxobolus squamalis]
MNQIILPIYQYYFFFILCSHYLQDLIYFQLNL